MLGANSCCQTGLVFHEMTKLIHSFFHFFLLSILSFLSSPEITMKILKTLNGKGIFKNDSIWFPVYYCFNTLWNYYDASLKLAKVPNTWIVFWVFCCPVPCVCVIFALCNFCLVLFLPCVIFTLWYFCPSYFYPLLFLPCVIFALCYFWLMLFLPWFFVLFLSCYFALCYFCPVC